MNKTNLLCKCWAKFNFDTFVIYDGNKVAYSAAKAVSRDPGVSFNPLFIYGGAGLGKTHLIQAAAHEVARTRKNFKIEYVTGFKKPGWNRRK